MKKFLRTLMLMALMLVPFASQAQETLTVHDGTTTNSNVPMWGLWADNDIHVEVVYPASDLDDMVGGSISTLKYYSSTSSVPTSGSSSWDGTFQIFMKEVTSTTISAFSGNTGATVVYSGSLSIVNGEMNITLSTPYQYQGGNLLIGFYYTSGGSYASASFYGETVSGASIYGRSGQSFTASAGNFIPKTTFTYDPANVSCARPGGLSLPAFSTESATITWDAVEGATSYLVTLLRGNTEVATTSMTSTTLVIDTLSPATNYKVQVRTYCGGTDTSSASSLSFRTLAALPVSEYPYFTGFEADQDTAWSYANHSTDKWYIGTAAKNTGSKGLYISNDGGATNAYEATNVQSYAWRTFAVSDTGDYAISFDWKCVGEGTEANDWDYLTVYVAPATADPQAGGGPGAGWVQLGGRLVAQETWTNSTTIIHVSNTGNYNLVFRWKTDGSTIGGAPAAVDNVNVIKISCPAIAHVQIDSASWTTTTTTLEWNYDVEALGFQYKYADSAFNPNVAGNTGMVTTTTAPLTGLQPGTHYWFYVRPICSVGDTGFWSSVFSFYTDCAVIPTTAIPYTEGFDSWTEMNPCWKRINSDNSSYMGLSTVTTNPDGTTPAKGLRFYPKSTNVHIISMPELESLAGLSVGFWMRGTDTVAANHTGIDLGVMTDPTDSTTFELIENFSVTLYNTWQYCEADLSSYTGTGKYVAFRGERRSTSASYVYVDNVMVMETPACARPDGISVRNITANSAELVIDDPNPTAVNNYSIMIIYQDSDTTMDTLYRTATDTVYTISDLMDNTAYQLVLTSVCSNGDVNQPNYISFRTKCQILTNDDMPWSEDFEDAATGSVDVSLPCWKRLNYGATSTSYLTYPTITTSSGHNSGKGLYFYCSTSSATNTQYEVAILPEVDNVANKTVSFYVNGSTNNLNFVLEVGVMTDPTDQTTFEAVQSYTELPESSWGYKEVSMASYTGTGKFIALRAHLSSGTYKSFYVDDVTIMRTPTCTRPTSVAVRNVGSTEATLFVNTTEVADSYILILKYDTVTETRTLNDTLATVDDLMPGTSYTFSLMADCGDGTVTSPVTGSFNTLAIPVTMADLPYSTGFEVGDDLQWEFFQGATDKWFIGTAAHSTGARALYISNNNGTGRTYSANKMCYAVRNFEFEAGSYGFSFDWSANGESSYDFLRVFLAPASATITADNFYDLTATTGVPTGWIDLAGQYLNLHEAWQTFSTDFDIAVNGTYRIVFMWRSDSSTQNAPAGAVDNVVVTHPTCPKPTVMVDNIDSVSAQLHITDSNESGNYEVLVYAPNDTVYNQTSGEQLISLSDLTANKTYTVKVIAHCEDGSAHTAITKSFKTSCEGILRVDLPWTESFDTYTGVSYSPAATNCVSSIPCWSVAASSSANYPYFYTSQHFNGANSLYTTGTATAPTVFALPTFEGALSELQFGMMYYTTSTTNSIEVGVMTNVLDPASFTAIQTITPTATSSWQSVEVTFAGVTTGNIAIRSKNGLFYLDSMVVDLLPACTRPSTVTVSDITTESATVAIADANNINNYKLVIYKNDTLLIDSLTVGNSHDLENLSVNSAYTLRVYTICSGGTLTDSMVVRFRTACAAYATTDLPWVEDFEAYTAMPLPCYDTIRSATSNLTISTTASRVHSGSKSLQFNGGADSPNMIVLPQFESNISGLQMSFWVLAESSSSSGQLMVGYITDIHDSTTFVPMATYTAGNQLAYSLQEVTFAGAPEGARIAFAKRFGSDSYWWWVDSVVVDVVPACTRPVISVSDITTSGATVTLADANEIGHYALVIYQDTNFIDSVEVNGTTETLTELSSGTGYTLYAYTICTDNTMVGPSSVVNFNTACDVITHDQLPYSEDFDSYATGTSAAIDPCWHKMSYYSTYPNYPYPNGSYSHTSGGNCLYFYPGTGANKAYQYAVLPEMDSLNDLQVSFFLYTGSSYYNYFRMTVGVMTDPTDTSTFTPVQQIPIAASSAWEFHKVKFNNYTGNGKYIAFRAHTVSTTGYFCLDDVEVVVAPSCDEPQSIVVRNITADSAELKINDAALVGNYSIHLAGSNGDTVDLTATDTVVTFANLIAASNYAVSVRAICTDGLATTAVTTTFQTLCESFTMPFTEDFEGITADIPTCWDNSEGTVTTASYKWNYYSTGHNGHGLRFNSYNASSGQYNVLATPSVTISGNAMLSFWYKNPTGGDFTVSYAVAGQSSTQVLATGLTGATDWTLAEYPLPATLNGQDVVFYFKGTSNYGYGDAYIYLDEVTVDVAPTCAQPTDFTEGTTTTSSISFSWTAGGEETQWIVRLNEGAWHTTNTPSYTANGLNASTSYAIEIRALCGDGDTSRTLEGAMSTDCGDVTIFPFNEGFESGLGCWTAIDGNSDNSTWFAVSGSSTVTPHSGNSMAASVSYNSGAVQADEYLVSPKLVLPNTDGTITLKWWFKVDGDYPEDSLTVLLSTTGNAAADFTTTLFGIMPTEDNDDWTSQEVSLTNYAGQPVYIAFYHTGYDANYLVLDDIEVSYTGNIIISTPCDAPTNIHTTALDSTSATLVWTSDAASWKVSLNNAPEQTVTNATVTYTSLTPSTTYTVKVKSVCEGGEESDWATYQFTTTEGPQHEGIDQVEMTSVNLYPNPASTMVTIDGIEGKAQVTVVDMNGRVSGEWNVMNGKLTIDVSGLAKGAYFVRIVGEQNSAIRKLVVK